MDEYYSLEAIKPILSSCLPFVTNHTTVIIPIIDPEKGPDLGMECGSGVFVKIKTTEGRFRYFILTAGHVLKSMTNCEYFGLVVSKRRHAFTFVPVKKAFIFNDESPSNDFGFLEIPEHKALSITRSEKRFHSLKELDIHDIDESKDWFCFTGYPKFGQRPTEGGITAHAYFHGVTTSLGSEGAPKIEDFSNLISPDKETINLWMNTHFVKMYPHIVKEHVQIEYAGGMSGGAIYKLPYFPGGAVSLVGINTYHVVGEKINNETAGVFRGVHIRKHLSFLADNYQDLLLEQEDK